MAVFCQRVNLGAIASPYLRFSAQEAPSINLPPFKPISRRPTSRPAKPAEMPSKIAMGTPFCKAFFFIALRVISLFHAAAKIKGSLASIPSSCIPSTIPPETSRLSEAAAQLDLKPSLPPNLAPSITAGRILSPRTLPLVANVTAPAAAPIGPSLNAQLKVAGKNEAMDSKNM